MTATQQATSTTRNLFIAPGNKDAVLVFNGEMNREGLDRVLMGVQRALPLDMGFAWKWSTAETVTSSALSLGGNPDEQAWNKVASVLGQHLDITVQVVTMETVRAYVEHMLRVSRRTTETVLGWMAETVSDSFSKPDTV
jgi:hypothetical protein